MKTLNIPFEEIGPMMELLYIAVPMNEDQHKALDAFWKKYPELCPHSFESSVNVNIDVPPAKPSECLLIRSIFDRCPETKEPQAIHAFRMDDSAVIFETRGKTTAWRHRIKTTEIDLP